MNSPKHRHDCDLCTFLASLGGRDLYACGAGAGTGSQGQKTVELLIRTSSEDGDYGSMDSEFVEMAMKSPPFNGSPLGVKYGLAYELAVAAGCLS